MPDFNTGEMAVLGIVAVLLMYNLQGDDPAPEPEDPPKTRTPAREETIEEWTQYLAEQMTKEGNLSPASDTAAPPRSATGILMDSAARGFEESTGASSTADLSQIDVVGSLADGNHGFISGRGV
jgi:cytoskeletal protein RodZ